MLSAALRTARSEMAAIAVATLDLAAVFFSTNSPSERGVTRRPDKVRFLLPGFPVGATFAVAGEEEEEEKEEEEEEDDVFDEMTVVALISASLALISLLASFIGSLPRDVMLTFSASPSAFKRRAL
jgi:hypothetical protein